MTRITKINGWTVRVNGNDHNPAHVHLIRAGVEFRIAIETAELMDAVNLKARDLKPLIAFVIDNREALIEAFYELNPTQRS